MTVGVLTALGKVLSNIDSFSWDHALYISQTDGGWLENLPCMVLDPEETDDPDDDPVEAKNNGLKYLLMISTVQDVVENAKAQQANIGTPQLIKALRYFYQNDAFLKL
jgi:hypothetical protein